MHLEIKSPNVVPEDQTYHPDFTKLGNLMKDEIDLMLKKDFPEDTPVFGILVGGNLKFIRKSCKESTKVMTSIIGHHANVFAMDLIYTKV